LLAHKGFKKSPTLMNVNMLRFSLALVIFSILTITVIASWDTVIQGWNLLLEAKTSYAIMALILAIFALVAQAEMMVVMLRSAGASVKRRDAYLTGMAANAWSSSLPGGAALSVVVVFREQKKWGVSSPMASWYFLLSGVLSAVSIAVLGVASILFFNFRVNEKYFALSILTVVLLIALAFVFNARPSALKKFVLPPIAYVVQCLGRDPACIVKKISNFISQLSQVKISRRMLFYSFFLAFLNWSFEIVCLILCAISVGVRIDILGIFISFVASKLAGQVQVTPGGVGTVDAVLTSALLNFGSLSADEAIAIVVLFRLITFLFLSILGWICFAFMKIRSSNPSG
jgi:uncharacterized protein (TIRG00374 family)